jgi:hypothetical protein
VRGGENDHRPRSPRLPWPGEFRGVVRPTSHRRHAAMSRSTIASAPRPRACCCAAGSFRPDAQAVETPRSTAGTASAARRCLNFAGYAVSVAVVVLLPKCPVCLAAYLAIGAGIGIAVSTAASLRLILLLFSLSWLAYGVSRGWRRIRHLMEQPAGPAPTEPFRGRLLRAWSCRRALFADRSCAG